MTRDDLIQWAKQSGAFLELSTTPEKDIAFLERFAHQVAKHIQEQCAKVCEQTYKDSGEDMEYGGCMSAAEDIRNMTV